MLTRIGRALIRSERVRVPKPDTDKGLTAATWQTLCMAVQNILHWRCWKPSTRVLRDPYLDNADEEWQGLACGVWAGDGRGSERRELPCRDLQEPS